MGRLALELVQRFEAWHLSGHVTMIFNIFSRHWTDPLADTLESLRAGAQLAIDSGDAEYWSYCHYWFGAHSLFLGHELSSIRADLDGTLLALDRRRQAKGRLLLHLRHLCDSLIGDGGAPAPPGDLPESELQARWTAANDWNSLSYCLGYQAVGAYFLGDFHGCIERLAVCDQFLGYLGGQSCLPVFLFYRAMSVLAVAGRRGRDDARVQATLAQFRSWATAQPINYAGKLQILEAELARCSGAALRAWRGYLAALSLARQSGIIQDEALAHERLGRFLLEQNDEASARVHLSEARQLYLRWGAAAVARRLGRDFPLLRLEADSAPAPLHLTADAVVESIDTRAVLRAAQALAGILDLPALLGRLMELLLQQSGADRACLVLRYGDQTRVHCSETGVSDLEQAQAPRSVVGLVLRTGDPLVLDDASRQAPADDYWSRRSVRSALCAPLLRQTQVVGAVYLENRLLPGAFTPDRIATVQVLAAQAAISIENARQFAQLQHQHEEILAERERSHAENLKVRTLEAHNNALASFVAIASHDLKNPVSAIRFWSQLIQPDQDEAGAAEVRRNIADACSRANGLIQSYLDAVTAEMGKPLQLQPSRFDLADLVRREIEFQRAGLTPECRLEAELEPTPLAADHDRLQQVVANLLSNAIRYSSFPIRLRIRLSEGRFEVEDRGPGIDDELKGRLFQAFERGNSDRLGSGLGLWICRVILEAHGGKIGVESQPGQGSTFWFQLS